MNDRWLKRTSIVSPNAAINLAVDDEKTRIILAVNCSVITARLCIIEGKTRDLTYFTSCSCFFCRHFVSRVAFKSEWVKSE